MTKKTKSIPLRDSSVDQYWVRQKETLKEQYRKKEEELKAINDSLAVADEKVADIEKHDEHYLNLLNIATFLEKIEEAWGEDEDGHIMQEASLHRSNLANFLIDHFEEYPESDE